MKMIKLQYPYDPNNKLFDGKTHIIIATNLYSFTINNNNFYLLEYFENGKNMITILIKHNGQFYKMPLDNYDYLINYINTHKLQKEPLDLLSNQNYISTTEIKNAENIFAENIINNQQQPEVAVAVATPPGGGSGNGPNGPHNPLAIASPLNPPFPPDKPEDFEIKEQKEEYRNYDTLYVGYFGSNFVIFKQELTENLIDQMNKGIVKFERFYETDKLQEEIRQYIFSNIYKFQRESEYILEDKLPIIQIDYGSTGNTIRRIETNIKELTSTPIPTSMNKTGEYICKIICHKFESLEEYFDLKSSSHIICKSNNVVYSIQAAFLSIEDPKMDVTYIDSFNNTKRKNQTNDDIQTKGR